MNVAALVAVYEGVPMKSSATKRTLVLITLVLSFTAVAVFAFGCGGTSPAYWPTDGWRASTPEEQGISSAALLKALDRVDEQQLNLHSLLVIRNGYLVSEVYYNPFTAEMAAPVASVTKSVTSALVGIAIDKGYIKDEQAKIVSFFPNKTIANLDARKQAMTVRDLVTMTGGLDYTDAVDPSAAQLVQSNDWVAFMLDRPMAADPGSTYSYSTGGAHLLSGVVAKATGESPRVFANENLFQPLGIAPVPESGWMADPQGVSFGGAGLSLTPRDMAKLGYLYLKEGKWDGQQIVSSSWAKSSTKLQTMKDDGYGEGYMWSLDTKQGSYFAHGAGGQEIYVLPSEQ
jgi:CubicO group peptidase (beta-lactamase class C family)